MRTSLLHVKNFLLTVSAFSVLLTAVTTVSAQYQIESWTTDNGLPQNTVHSIAQTPDGYLWLATLDGLVRYDGVRFSVFNKSNTQGIESNRFTHLAVDGKGDLWARTESGGITRRHQGEFQTYGSDDLSGKIVKHFLLNAEGNLVAFTDAEIFEWNGERFAPYAPVAGEKYESAVLWSKNGAFWYSTGRTLYRFKDNQTSEYRLPGDEDGALYIIKLFEDSRGRIWIGTVKAGLFVLENEKFTAYDERDGISGTYVSPRIEDRNGNVWAVTNDGAVVISEDGEISRLTTAQGLSDNNLASLYTLNSIYEDREGNVWIGTLYGGLNRVSRQSARFYTTKEGLQADVVNPIYQARDESVWIGGNNLTRYAAGNFSAVAAWKNCLSR
jgi:ligand-binding sensor domain-containing protein